MLPDISALTFAERQELVFGLITKWLGPIEVPSVAEGKRGLGIFPLVAQVPYGHMHAVRSYVNVPFKPFRIVVLESMREWEEHIEKIVQPVVKVKRWWGKEKVIQEERVVVEEKRITHLETVTRNQWTIGSIFVGDQPQLLNGGADVGGDAFAPDKTCDYDFSTAQVGHQIAMAVCHCVPHATLTFRAIVLGTRMWRSEMDGPFEPHLEAVR